MNLQVVRVHGVRLDELPEVHEAYCSVLSIDEIRRSERFANERLRRRWAMSRAGLRRVLAAYCGVPASALRFECGTNGKPCLAGDDAGLHFNLSHSGNLAIVGVTEAGPVGVDLEWKRPIPDWARVARRFFSARENDELAALPAHDRAAAFYRCWTRKEAIIKATGEGLSAELDAFDVTLAPDAPARVVHDRRHDRGEPGSWQLHHLDPEDGFVGAVAIRNSTRVPIQFEGIPQGSRPGMLPMAPDEPGRPGAGSAPYQ